MKSLRFLLLVLVFVTCVGMAASTAWASYLVYGARGTSDTAVGIDPVTLAYAGVQSNLPGPPREDLLGSDISTGGGLYAYMVDTGGHIQQLYRDTLSATGLKTDASTGWDDNDIFISIDVGVDGYLYAARDNGAAALKIDPLTLRYAGAYSNNGGAGLGGLDISVGASYAYMVNSDGRIVQLTANTLSYTGVATNWSSGGNIFISVDVGTDGYVYAARSTDTAVKIDPLTLAYMGVQTRDGNNDMICKDISMGWDYGYAVRSDGYIIRLDKNTLAAGPGTGWPSGGNLFVSVDVPEPCSLALLAGGLVSLLAYAWRRRK